MIIESVDNKKIKELRKLKEKKYRDGEKLFLVEGEHLVLEAYKSNLLKEVILCEREIDLDVEKVYVNEKVMNSLSDSLKNGINPYEKMEINPRLFDSKVERIKELDDKVVSQKEFVDFGN